MGIEFTKKIVLLPELDDASFKKLQERLKKLKIKPLGEDDEDTRKKINDARKQINDKFIDNLKKTAEWSIDSLKSLFSDAWSELRTISDFSRLSNANTRNLAFRYGFNSSQAYGYSQAMSMMGFQSEEDLMYATADELTEFKNLFSKYTDWYEGQGQEELQLYRDFQIELAELQQDMRLTVVDFFMDNKDTIEQSLELGIKVGEFLLTSIGTILTYFGGKGEASDAERRSAVLDALNSYSTNTVTSNNFNNTFNVSGADRQASDIASEMLLLFQKTIPQGG